MKKIAPNENKPLLKNPDLRQIVDGGWVKKNTAILVIHGIGNQNPLETLDSFGRKLVEQYLNAGFQLKLEHKMAKKNASGDNTPWFDNFLRVKNPDTPDLVLDIYEYYWASETEDQATFKDLNKWLSNATAGAKKFYKQNVQLAVNSNDESLFVKNGEFHSFNYWLFVNLIPSIFVFVNWLLDVLYKLLCSIPIIGAITSSIFKKEVDGTLEKLSNVLNDISIYNTVDAKSRFFKIRRCILDGAVDALKYLLESRTDPNDPTQISFAYENVLLAGHSLGSQIAFDAVNRINHLVNQGEIKGYGCDGVCAISGSKPIHEKLVGLVTFGSPLDKIAFFLREQVTEPEYIRGQILAGFHGFKQRNWSSIPDNNVRIIVQISNKRLFDKILWHNYWDQRDYISGSLDFYQDVVNIDCKFPSKSFDFTHSRYWDSPEMFQDIIDKFLKN